MNSFAASIDTSHPEATIGISKYTVASALFDSDDPGGTDAPFLLMETNGDPGSSGALGNDAYAGRQYLYPTAVPEPRAWLLLSVIVGLGVFAKKTGLVASLTRADDIGDEPSAIATRRRVCRSESS
ncbi:hypothetical protein ACFL2H_03590 [Planctomycetota bacterium]